MGDKKLQKFCRIFQWIEREDPELARAIRDLCLEGALSPSPAHRGITFLFPDEKRRKEIDKIAYGDDPDKASEIIRSYIIPDIFLSPSDFASKDRQCGNHLGVGFGKPTAHDSDSVTFKDFKIEKAKTFKAMNKRSDDISVWKVVSGSPPMKGEAYSAPKKERREKPAKVGRGEQRVSARLCLLQKAVDGLGVKNVDPFLAYVVSFLNFLKWTGDATLDRISFALDYEPIVSFFILFEPFRCSDYFIPDEVFNKWPQVFMFRNASEEYLRYFNVDRTNVAKQADATRQSLQNTRAVAAQLCDGISKAYQNYDRSGLIGGSAVIESTPAPGRKLWQDELRHVLGAMMYNFRLSCPPEEHCDKTVICEIIANIGDCYGGEYGPKLICLPKILPARRFAVPDITSFLMSTDFLYAASSVVSEKCNDPVEPGSDSSPWDRNACGKAYVNSLSMAKDNFIDPRLTKLAEIVANMAKQ